MGWGEAAIVGVRVLVGVGVGADVGVGVGIEAGVGEIEVLASFVVTSIGVAGSSEPQAVTTATVNTISAVTQLPTQGFTIRPLPFTTHSLTLLFPLKRWSGKKVPGLADSEYRSDLPSTFLSLSMLVLQGL